MANNLLDKAVQDFFRTHYNDPVQVLEHSKHDAVALSITPPNPSRYCIVFTMGNSVRERAAIGFPNNCGRYELCMLLPKTYWTTSKEKGIPHWAYSLPLRVGSYVASNKLAVIAPLTFVEFPTGSVVIPNRAFCGVMLVLHEQLPATNAGQSVNLLSMIPVFKQEMQFEKIHGTREFFRLLSERNVPMYIDIDRTSAV